MLQERPPQAVRQAMERHQPSDAPIFLTTATDISPEGRFERQWLIVCRDRLTVFTDESDPRVVSAVGLAEVEEFRTHGVVGSGFVQARVGGVWVDVLRYSNSLAGRFARVVRKLEQLRSEGHLECRPEDDVDERRCGQCGLALSYAGDVCPRCINRGAVLGRQAEEASKHLESRVSQGSLVLTPDEESIIEHYEKHLASAVGRPFEELRVSYSGNR